MRIGLTGIIGSGKSTVINYLKSKGYECFDCDNYAHLLLEDSKVIEEIVVHFDCLENGVINRKKLGGIVFNDSQKLRVLEGILHPRIKEKILSLDEEVIVDMPLLYEAKMDGMFDKVIAVLADKEILISRLMERDNFTRNEAIRRIELQIDVEEKKNRADYVIMNNDTLDVLYKNIDDVMEGLYV